MPARALALTLCCALVATPALAASYAKPQLLASAEDAAGVLESPRAVVLDVRSPEAFSEGTIPGARRVDVSQWKAKINEGAGADFWSEQLGALGVREDSTVIVFDEAVTPTAARAWWVLKYWGVDDARLLNGGWTAWRRAGLKTAPGDDTPPDSSRPFPAEAQPERLATTGEVLNAAAGDGATCLVDTRTQREVGEGVIPSARHLEWSDLVHPQTGELRSAEQLQRMLARVGFDPKSPAVSYCRSGGRASVMAFAMELMGGEKVANYFGSYSAWSSTPGAPVVQLDLGDSTTEPAPPAAED